LTAEKQKVSNIAPVSPTADE